jgi:2-polyprenyl-3-methyl-5-hydroxy-6-metoxy-1,4-benzoquinol methylase
MNIIRERFGSGMMPIWVRNEHQARWLYACNYVADKIVVDCACGVGEGTFMFAQAGARQVHAFDLSLDAINATKKRCEMLSNVTARQASGLALPLESSSVDVFISFETIEHIEDDGGFLNEVVRLLAPSGVFICSTPNRSISMPGKQLGDKPWNSFHIREYNASELDKLLKEKFSEVVMLGQNLTPNWRVSLLGAIGKIMPGNIGGRINSALKIPRFAYDKLAHHLVVNNCENQTGEYLVAICKVPRR